jgi:adenosine deaminase
VTVHLHLHLEPGERKRGVLAGRRPDYSNSRRFFAEHYIGAPGRLDVSLDDLTAFVGQLHSEQRSQGASYVEWRLSPRRFMVSGASLADTLRRASDSCAGSFNPILRIVLLLNRDSPASFIESCEEAIRQGLPPGFVGIDLAGDEVRYPDVRPFESCFRAARAAGLGVTVHAGEFGDARAIWLAVDRLGAMRIGHGVAAGGCRALAARLRRDDIMLEVSVTSNVRLGAVPAARQHPLPWLIGAGVPVCLNTDVPLHLGSTLSDEWGLAAVLLDDDASALMRLRDAASRYAFAGSQGSSVSSAVS